MIGHGFMEENGQTPSPKKDISSPQYRRFPRNLKFSKPLATRSQKIFSPSKNIFMGGWGIYTMENKNTKTDYQEVVRVGDQK